MQIDITAAAIEKINERTADRKGFLKLKYDTDGCGCAVNGVIALWFVPAIDQDDDLAIETNDRPVYVEKAKTVFLDDDMKIDFSQTANCFQLKSPQQILNGRMSLMIKEKTD
ncbi:iron-sulfur cluster biosynthesis family protein [Bacillus sp. 1P10SD]|uniref:iron-sulfur cluster biosynthesis family protein n=1 Tax=Bacillus sp. 1P10SD TaxID=3132265 RepID=UPI0039A5C4CA